MCVCMGDEWRVQAVDSVTEINYYTINMLLFTNAKFKKKIHCCTYTFNQSLAS